MIEVEKVHTKVLIQYLDKARKFGGFYSPEGNSGGWGYTTE